MVSTKTSPRNSLRSATDPGPVTDEGLATDQELVQEQSDREPVSYSETRPATDSGHQEDVHL